MSRTIEYTLIMNPRVETLVGFRKAVIGTEDMAAFLGVMPANVRRLSDSGRIPMPMPIGSTMLWSVSGLLDWVAAGCPRRGKWIEMRAGRR